MEKKPLNTVHVVKTQPKTVMAKPVENKPTALITAPEPAKTVEVKPQSQRYIFHFN